MVNDRTIQTDICDKNIIKWKKCCNFSYLNGQCTEKEATAFYIYLKKSIMNYTLYVLSPTQMFYPNLLKSMTNLKEQCLTPH